MTGARDEFAVGDWESMCDLIDELREESAYLESWDGIMSVLDTHYPPDVFTGTSGDPGPRMIVLIREVDNLRCEVDRLENDIDGHRQHYTCTPERMAP